MKFVPILLMLSIITGSLFAQTPMPLYPNGIPNSKPTPPTYKEKGNDWGGVEKVSIPTLTPYLLKDGKPHTAVLVIPGGGYSGVAMAHEGDSIARAFNKIGVAAFVLKYRLPSDSIMVDKTIGPLQDAQSALVVIRKSAKLWNIDPAKVGV